MIKVILKAAVPVLIFMVGIIGIGSKVFAGSPWEQLIVRCVPTILCNDATCMLRYPFTFIKYQKFDQGTNTYQLSQLQTNVYKPFGNTNCYYSNEDFNKHGYFVVYDDTNTLTEDRAGATNWRMGICDGQNGYDTSKFCPMTWIKK